MVLTLVYSSTYVWFITMENMVSITFKAGSNVGRGALSACFGTSFNIYS